MQWENQPALTRQDCSIHHPSGIKRARKSILTNMEDTLVETRVTPGKFERLGSGY